MNRVVPGAPVVKTLPPSVEVPVQSLIRELRSHMPHSKKQQQQQQKTTTIKQKQCCNTFNKDFKVGPHQK